MQLEKFVSEDIEKIESEMRTIISTDPKEVYGLLDEYLFRGGKRIRPMLLMLSFRMMKNFRKDSLENEKTNAIKAAAIIELFHNFTLIHDDLEDNSQFRRGKPTLHILYTLPIAVNSGDALYTLLWEKILKLPVSDNKKIVLSTILAHAFRQVVEGQGIELEWYKSKKIAVTEQEYFDMVLKKTGALIGASAELGAYLAGSDTQTCEKFRMFGNVLGVAFQIQDDILNIVGDFKKYKKEIYGDIREGKRTLMVIHTISCATKDEKKQLFRILLSNTEKKQEIEYVVSLFEKYNSINYAKSKAQEFIKKIAAFLNEFPESKERNMLKQVCEYVINREL